MNAFLRDAASGGVADLGHVPEEYTPRVGNLPSLPDTKNHSFFQAEVMKARWEIVPAAPAHVAPIAAHMREADRREVWTSHRHTPLQALEASLAASTLAWTCLVDGIPAFMWGVARRGSLLSTTGAPWLLGTSAMWRVQRDFLRQCPAYVAAMQAAFPRLENYVHAENSVSLRWLRWLGFAIDTGTPWLFGGEQFYKFTNAGGASVHKPAVVVRQTSVAEVFANPAFAALAKEYAAEAAIARLPEPQAKIAAYKALEASGSDTFCVFGAFVGEALVGLVVLLTPVLPHYGRAIAVAESLFVCSAYRGTGAGMLLIRQAEKQAKATDSPGLLFSAPSGGRLSALLPRIDYRETNRVYLKEFSHEE